MEPCRLTHVMLVSFPGQGHINPLLRLGKLIASKGLLVTFVTTEEPLGKKMRQANKIQDGVIKPVGLGFLRFEFFSDGLADDHAKRANFNTFRPHLEAVGKQEIKNLVKRYDKEPVTCLINNAFVPWVCDVAQELQIPLAILWVQSCACLTAYYYYHHRLVKFPTETEPDINVEITCLPLFKHDEIPSFLHPSSPYTAYGEVILDQFKRLENDKLFYLFIDTFYELEKDIINHMSHLCPQAIISPVGPLFKMAQTISSDVKGDISEPAGDCIEWLDSREPSSIVYISFGTIVRLKQEQMEEIAHGVLSSGLSFLWVVRPPGEGSPHIPHVLPRELEEKGKIVEWCPQERVLAHPAIACFLSHCGWNSTMEALTSGVPVVCFPQWGDQVTDAVYLVDVFKTGVRLGRGAAEEKVVPREVVAEKLLEATVGEKAAELRENAQRWKKDAETAVAYGGSSDKNFREFVDKFLRNM
ncbi:PREDICTED: UDP-glycosyltransferase 84A3 [Camelina sativa]|uniref:Glycosyltransferase n=1 Tax=Camelina sativa TaxID=90675 RepID=A0ABM0U2T6_CAMSA|nr:PREDICTED: UDP-glycosyltransferase 84A3 [Camelina sativa]